MQVHLFGATSSPNCAELTLRRTADDHANLFEAEVLSTVHRFFMLTTVWKRSHQKGKQWNLPQTCNHCWKWVDSSSPSDSVIVEPSLMRSQSLKGHRPSSVWTHAMHCQVTALTHKLGCKWRWNEIQGHGKWSTIHKTRYSIGSQFDIWPTGNRVTSHVASKGYHPKSMQAEAKLGWQNLNGGPKWKANLVERLTTFRECSCESLFQATRVR